MQGNIRINRSVSFIQYDAFNKLKLNRLQSSNGLQYQTIGFEERSPARESHPRKCSAYKKKMETISLLNSSTIIPESAKK